MAVSDESPQTEFEFTLPRGYEADDGTRHREGTIRLATAADEIKPLNDPRVQSNPAYLPVLVLSRAVTQLGSLDDVTPRVIESLYVADLEYLQDLYERINERGAEAVDAVCPECGAQFTVGTGSGAHLAGEVPSGLRETADFRSVPRPAIRGGLARRHWGRQ